MITALDLTFVNKVIKTNLYELRFKYNTDQNYFYYDVFDRDGNVIEYHNKVATGKQRDGYIFTSNDGSSYATAENITEFNLVADE